MRDHSGLLRRASSAGGTPDAKSPIFYESGLLVSVSVEANTVVVSRATLEDSFPGGFAAFCAEAPNQTLRADDYLAAISFMTMEDVRHFVDLLSLSGLQLLSDEGSFVDIAIVVQGVGPTASCPWLAPVETLSDPEAVYLSGTSPDGPPAVVLPGSSGTMYQLPIAQMGAWEQHVTAEGTVGFTDPQSGTVHYMASSYGVPMPGPIEAHVDQYLRALDVDYEHTRSPDNKFEAFLHAGEEALFVQVYAFDDRGQLLVFIYPLDELEQADLAEVAELANSLNSALTIGSYELAGEPKLLRFRVSVGGIGSVIQSSVELVDQLVGDGVWCVMQSLGALRSVIAGDLSASAAIEELARDLPGA